MYVRMRIEIAANEWELAALLWDGLVSASEVEPTAAMVGLLSKAQVRGFVRARVAYSGTGSVICGPVSEENYSDEIEAACLSAVRRAFMSEGDL